jgi:hypothetical protein
MKLINNSGNDRFMDAHCPSLFRCGSTLAMKGEFASTKDVAFLVVLPDHAQ